MCHLLLLKGETCSRVIQLPGPGYDYGRNDELVLLKLRKNIHDLHRKNTSVWREGLCNLTSVVISDNEIIQHRNKIAH